MKAIIALALVLTYGTNTYELRTRAGTTVSRGHATEAACVAAITEPGEYRCAPTGVITAVGVCDPIPPGFVENLDSEVCPGTDPAYRFKVSRQVQSAYPACAVTEEYVWVSDCSPVPTWWTPDPDGYVPAP